jgi:hypothetical protein
MSAKFFTFWRSGGMIATLKRFLSRTMGVGFLVMALGVTCPWLARAQSTDAAQQSGASYQPTNPPAASAGESTKPADAPASKPDASASSGSSSGADTAAGSDSSTKSDSSAKSDSGAQPASPSSGHYAIHEALQEFHPPMRTGDDAFDRASESFPAFCKDWERRLHDRELNNVESVSWKDQDGFKTGTYLAYSPIKTCNCKRSTGGVPIGELTYQETEYYLAGRTVEEARHAQPKTVGVTNTTEIFRWDRTKWDDGR